MLAPSAFFQVSEYLWKEGHRVIFSTFYLYFQVHFTGEGHGKYFYKGNDIVWNED